VTYWWTYFANSPEIRIDSCLLWHPREEVLTCVAKAVAKMLSCVLENCLKRKFGSRPESRLCTQSSPAKSVNKIELVKTRYSIRLNVLDILVLALQVVPMAEIIASSRNGVFPR
jgi:hypothetical protein